MPPPEGDAVAVQAAGNNSSDFVRKLYKMLEDPAYRSVVRWSSDGDSFVVLENEKFTKTILPKHFKHSNFASFVRQLNKYDFHKVRHNEENGDAPYGKDAWEFRHPEFRADRKDNLDNIRRKAPAPRKAQPVEEPFPATQQVVLLNDQLVATQHQVQALQEQYYELAGTNKILVSEVLGLTRMVKAQHQIANELINHLNNIDEKRRDSRHSAHSSNHSSNSNAAFHSGQMNSLPDGTDEPAAELRRARELLNSLSPEFPADRELERLSIAYHNTGSPPDSATSSSVMYSQPPSNGPPMHLHMHDPFNDPRHMVYPVGQTAGIDPFHQDHIQNIPYSRPLSTPSGNAIAEAPSQITPPPKDAGGSLWGSRKPRVLLVEDDKTCARIGAKFLTNVDCTVEIARDGSEAVNKVNQEPMRYDLIFMDIIMPMFDGVSATACIRLVAPDTPIVAMTSNIRQEDIATYFHFGMNDVLAKPFTREGMVRILKKHLTKLLKNPPAPGSASDDISSPGVQHGPNASYANAMATQAQISMQQQIAANNAAAQAQMAAAAQQGQMQAAQMAAPQVKFEGTPMPSPTTTSSWHSPSTMNHTTPTMDGGGGAGGYMSAVGSGPMALTPGGSQRPQYVGGGQVQLPQIGTPTLSRMQMPDGSGMDDGRPEKRARLGYGQVGPGGYPQ
ncbi:response regulator-like protein [Coniochaeta sp. 2T2.1]|nr:response regulator-like protein [Coniochaeta sp. 2T2.1]